MRTKATTQKVLSFILAAFMIVLINDHVKAQCSANFTDSTHCSNNVYFTDLSIAGGGYINSWQWDFGDGASSTVQHPVHTYVASGSYTVTLIIQTASGCFDTVVHDIIIQEQPVADFTTDTSCAGCPTQFTDLSIPGAGNSIISWYWYFGDGSTSTIQNPIHTYVVPDTFLVTLIIVAECGYTDTVSKEVIVLPNSLVEDYMGNDIQLKIYPNPVNNQAYINFHLEHPAITRLTLYSTSGEVMDVITNYHQAGEHQLLWSTDGLEDGVYILKMTVGEKLYTSKIIKAR